MKIGVDSSVLIAGVHANHPLHALAAGWLIHNIPSHSLIVAHNSILETYAVLSRLPCDLRLTGPETKQLLESTIKPNMEIAEFHASSIWDCIELLVSHSAVGGQSYDAFIDGILSKSGAEAIATFNTTHFNEFASQLILIDPSKLS